MDDPKENLNAPTMPVKSPTPSTAAFKANLPKLGSPEWGDLYARSQQSAAQAAETVASKPPMSPAAEDFAKKAKALSADKQAPEPADAAERVVSEDASQAFLARVNSKLG